MRITRSNLRLLVLMFLLMLSTIQHANAEVKVEDHSLPKSVVKTFHVKCSNGRLGMVRYDTRKSPVNMCVSVQDGSRPQSCVVVTAEQAQQHVQTLAQWVCQ